MHKLIPALFFFSFCAVGAEEQRVDAAGWIAAGRLETSAAAAESRGPSRAALSFAPGGSVAPCPVPPPAHAAREPPEPPRAGGLGEVAPSVRMFLC